MTKELSGVGREDIGGMTHSQPSIQRRRWSAEQKQKIVAVALRPGMSVAVVARRHGLNSNMIYRWMQDLGKRSAVSALPHKTAQNMIAVGVVPPPSNPSPTRR